MDENNENLPSTVEEKQISEVVEKVTPVSMMTNALSTFMADIFEEVRQEDMYINTLRQDIIADLPKMKPSEKIALITSETTNRNDMASKVISPTMQLLTTMQQNEIAERKERMKEQEQQVLKVSNVSQVSEIAPGEVLAGLQALFNMQTIITPERKTENEKVIALNKKESDETPFANS